MKKLQIIFICLPLFVIISSKGFAQERMQSIEKGISLLGNSKSSFLSYIINKGYRFDNKTTNGDIIDYSKQVRYGQSHISFHLANQKIAGISWQEEEILGQEYLTSLRDENFQIELHAIDGSQYGQPDIKTFVCKNYSRNIVVDVIFKTDQPYFTIIVDKLNVDQHLDQQNKSAFDQNAKVPNEVTHHEDQYTVVAQKAYFFDVNDQGVVKRKAYLVYGETITGLQIKSGYVYCVFTNSVTKKTSKGWILLSDLSKAASELVQNTSSSFNFTELIKFN